jgi:hypothetical protein
LVFGKNSCFHEKPNLVFGKNNRLFTFLNYFLYEKISYIKHTHALHS